MVSETFIFHIYRKHLQNNKRVELLDKPPKRIAMEDRLTCKNITSIHHNRNAMDGFIDKKGGAGNTSLDKKS